MRAFGTPVIDYVPALAAALAAALYLATAYGYSPDARAAPLLIGWSVMVLAALDMAARTKTGFGERLNRALGAATTHGAGGHGKAAYPLGRQFAAVAWLAAFVAAFALIGAVYAIPLYVFAATRLRGKRSKKPHVTWALVFPT